MTGYRPREDSPFPPATCQVSGGGRNFAAFSAGTPIKIVDSNPNLTEVATPSSVYHRRLQREHGNGYSHVPPFYLTSGTGGLQEAITANQTTDGPNTIVLNAEWYRLISPGNAAGIIASVHGIPDLGLVDITTTPYTSTNGTDRSTRWWHLGRLPATITRARPAR